VAKGHYRHESALDLHTPLTDDEHLTLLKVWGLGMGPLEPEPIKRQQYDELYLKQKRMREL
jgi:hypothetical protein